MSVVVLEKGSEPGAHILSGAIMDPKAITELFPNWTPGSFSVNSVPSFGTVAAAHMKESSIAMLRQHRGESMLELLDRLEFAIIEAMATGYVVDEVNVRPPKKSRRK